LLPCYWRETWENYSEFPVPLSFSAVVAPRISISLLSPSELKSLHQIRELQTRWLPSVDNRLNDVWRQ
jgi:hypothetical protein